VPGWPVNDEERDPIESIVYTTVTDPVGPEFMAPSARS
jgi:hypothetical protein